MGQRQPYSEWLDRQRIDLDSCRSRRPGFRAGHADRSAWPPSATRWKPCRSCCSPGQRADGSAGFDGQRRGAGGDVRKAAHALRLLQAAFRPGHQPADRLDPRRSHHGVELLHRPGRQSARAGEEHCHRLRIPHPILSNEELAALEQMDHRGWKTQTIDITFPAGSGSQGLSDALDRICAEASEAIAEAIV